MLIFNKWLAKKKNLTCEKKIAPNFLRAGENKIFRMQQKALEFLETTKRGEKSCG